MDTRFSSCSQRSTSVAWLSFLCEAPLRECRRIHRLTRCFSCFRMIPETKGRSLEEMDIIFGSVKADQREADIARQEQSTSFSFCRLAARADRPDAQSSNAESMKRPRSAQFLRRKYECDERTRGRSNNALPLPSVVYHYLFPSCILVVLH